MTTTQTTTHFFSLPLWRRRAAPAYSPRDKAARSTDELGLMPPHPGPSSTSSTLHPRDKDLPPTPELGTLTPPRLSPDPPSQQERDDATRIARSKSTSRSGPASAASSRASSLQPVSRSSCAPSDSPNPTQPTVVLARAGIGLGLPYAAPASVSPSSSTEINTVTFFPHSPSMTDLRPPNPMLRHAKSFHRQPETSAEPASQSASRERRRTRGLSLGPLNLLSSDTKGKQRQVDSDGVPPETKPLSRKGSFWSRKRVNSRPNTPVVPPSPTPQPTLPAFPPISPFNVSTPVPSSGLTVDQPTELQRRHSERMRRHSPRKDDEKPPPEASPRLSTNSIHARRRRGSQRPQTADSATNPSPRLSFFSETRPFVASPASSPLPTPLEQPAPPPGAPDRSRAQTNPPLLHRLSVNLFGGSSSSNTHTPTSTSSPNILDGQGLTSPPSSLGSSRPSLSLKPSVEIPRPRSDEESPEVYLQRLVEAVSKAEVATVLASRLADRLCLSVIGLTFRCYY